MHVDLQIEPHSPPVSSSALSDPMYSGAPTVDGKKSAAVGRRLDGIGVSASSVS